MRISISFVSCLFAVAAFFLPHASANADAVNGKIAQIANGWDRAAFDTPDPKKEMLALRELERQTAALETTHPGHPAIGAWRGIIIATQANISDGLPALKLADKARKQLERVMAQNPDPLNDGFAPAILGALYDEAPGFPVGFGDKKKARARLEHAVRLNPSGMDTNFFYASHLAGRGDFAEAQRYLETALKAEPRPGRELADMGRRQDVVDLMKEIKSKTSRQ